MMKLKARQTAGTFKMPSITGKVLQFRSAPAAQAIDFINSAASPQTWVPTIDPEDWSDLFDAVQDRLSQAVAAQGSAGPEAAPAQLARLAHVVSECGDALQKLHDAQIHTRVRHQQMALEMFDTRTALAQLRSELSGTKAREQQARHQSLHDGLTQLPNRDHFGHRLQQAAIQPQALAVMFIDLDGFKQINDLHGHATGDELLKIVSARLAQNVRSSDLVARLGGDEFACLVTGLSDQQQLSEFARKLFDHVAQPIQIGPLSLSMRPSIGIALRQTPDTCATTLLSQADTAMYLAKREQTGHAFYQAA